MRYNEAFLELPSRNFTLCDVGNRGNRVPFSSTHQFKKGPHLFSTQNPSVQDQKLLSSTHSSVLHPKSLTLAPKTPQFETALLVQHSLSSTPRTVCWTDGGVKQRGVLNLGGVETMCWIEGGWNWGGLEGIIFWMEQKNKSQLEDVSIRVRIKCGTFNRWSDDFYSKVNSTFFATKPGHIANFLTSIPGLIGIFWLN